MTSRYKIESGKLLLDSIQRMINCVTRPILPHFVPMALCESILNHILSQIQNYITKNQVQNSDDQYIIRTAGLVFSEQPDSFFPETSIQFLIKPSSDPLQNNPSTYDIDMKHELTGIVVFHCLDQLLHKPDFQLSEEIQNIFEEYLDLSDFDKFYPTFLQLLNDMISINRNYISYCKEIILQCIEKLNGTTFTDLKNKTDEFLAKLIHPFPVNLYIEFKNKILPIKQKDEKDWYRTFCDDILDDDFTVASNFEFNNTIYEYSLVNIKNLFGHIISTEAYRNLESDNDYDEEDIIFFCISFYLIFNYLVDSDEDFYVLDFGKFNQMIQDIDGLENIADTEIYDLHDKIENAKSCIKDNYFGR